MKINRERLSLKHILPRTSGFMGSSRSLISLIQREADSGVSSRETLSAADDSPLVRALSSSSSGDGLYGDSKETTATAVLDQKHLDDYKIVKTKTYGKLPQICMNLAKTYEQQRRGGGDCDFCFDMDPVPMFKARKALHRSGVAAVIGDANTMLVLLLDFFESLAPQDTCLSPFSATEMNLMATVLNKREREGEDCYTRAVSDLADRAPLHRNLYVWLVDFLATIAGPSHENILVLAKRFGPALWQRQHDVKLLNPEEVARAEKDAITILGSCIHFARRSRQSATDEDKVGQPF